jgi:hypothetical protein
MDGSFGASDELSETTIAFDAKGYLIRSEWTLGKAFSGCGRRHSHSPHAPPERGRWKR